MLLKTMKILCSLVERDHPAGVFTDSLVTEHDGPLDVGESLAGQSKEHVEGGEGGALVGCLSVQTEVPVVGNWSYQPTI